MMTLWGQGRKKSRRHDVSKVFLITQKTDSEYPFGPRYPLQTRRCMNARFRSRGCDPWLGLCAVRTSISSSVRHVVPVRRIVGFEEQSWLDMLRFREVLRHDSWNGWLFQNVAETRQMVDCATGICQIRRFFKGEL